ncbi:enoyl-CoA hydratase [Minwuia thermotolerans]|uniref:Enoyl-CoA hydratase domain-containing protein 3, mitochondrial n=1 Tax=Minwuia thermotolerans TaxID=2056226 RepID=A0A2M9G694_9PROT|nr:enoyl-CoA hydratase [Minwuia thermotolerans]PJK31231.1 enoyl-CoA hydratase [Minwuia thermotolerans]
MSAAAEAATPNEDILLREDRDGIAWITLNRPNAFNSLSRPLIARLQEELDRMADDPSVRVIVIAGAGRGFCAGHDLREVRGNQNNEPFIKELVGACSNMMQTIVHHPKPVIARVHGIATAAGCQLVASCDLAIAEDGARFATPGVNIGLFCHTPMVALSRNVSRKHAMEMLLTGEMMDADDAVRFGLINRAVPAGKLDEAVMEMAGKIASKSSYTLKVGKRAFYDQLEQPDLKSAYDHASITMVENMAARDAAEGIQAFIDKRQPKWEDR